MGGGRALYETESLYIYILIIIYFNTYIYILIYVTFKENIYIYIYRKY